MDRLTAPSYRFSLGCCASTAVLFPSRRSLPTCVAYPLLLGNFLNALIEALSCILAICSLCIGDAESAPIEEREAEIRKALEKSSVESSVCVVCLVPVRMQEAWLLIDEAALRRAAGNPNGTQPLDIPDVQKLEELSDPKQLILRASASGKRTSRASPRAFQLAVERPSRG